MKVKLKLQHFAEAELETKDEVLDEVQGEKAEVIEEVSKPEEDTAPKPKEAKDESVPLSVFLKTKSEVKQYKKLLDELQKTQIDLETTNKRAELQKMATEKGFDQEFAAFFAEQLTSVETKLRQEVRGIQDIKDDPYEDDIEDLTRNEITNDAKTYKDAIVSKMKEFKQKGVDIDAEAAYWMVRNPKLRMKELIEDKEQKQLIKRSTAEEKITPQSRPTAPKNPYPLDEADKKALRRLQEFQPYSGWTEEKYYNSRYGKK
jgi:hypothetical protein